MNTQFLFRLRAAIRWAGVVAVLLLAACNLPFSMPATSTLEYEALPPPVAAPTLTSAPSASAVHNEPGVGTVMSWVDGSDFVYVPPSEFTMGADKPEGKDFNPAHTVSLGGFWIQQTEVTNRMYAQCVAAGICTLPFRETGTPYWYADSSRADYPVVGVDWDDAQTYCMWIEAVLPTEAQWEKTARGSEARLYPWGKDDPTCDLLNFKDCLIPSMLDRVHSYLKGDSPYKAADMAGNVFEWVNDRYAADYYSQSPAADPPGPATGQKRVTRSSSFRSLVDELKVVLRRPENPTLHRADLGFRCVLTGEALANTPPAACSVPAYVPASAVPGSTSSEDYVAPYLTNTFCMERGPADLGFATIDLGSVESIDSLEITSPDWRPICSTIPGMHRISCTGSALRPGTTATLTLCPRIVSAPLEEPVCPTGYVLDRSDGLCHYRAPVTTRPEDCTADEAWEAAYGCVPLAGSGPVPCPPGYFEVFTHDPAVPHECWPVDGETGSTEASCLTGSYASDLDCCQTPPDMPPLCNTGYSYDTRFSMCVPHSIPDGCVTLTFDVPLCPTEPPPPPPACYCCRFDQKLCPSPACVWVGSSCRPAP